jgi:glutamyl-tRNA reductase
MRLLAVGLSHRTAPIAVLERAAVGPDDLSKLLDELISGEHVTEALLLSTCNRIEVYAVVETFRGGLAEVSAVLARHAGCGIDDLADHLFVHHAGSAVQHLFRVAAGLESLVVGEAQILGQIRIAYALAGETGAVGRTLHELAQQALRVGKRVHSETGIDAAGPSLVSEALTAAAGALDGLRGRRALIIGAGSLAALAAAQLRRRGMAEIVVANRTPVKAGRLAAAVAAEGTPARAVGFDAVAAELATADIVIACTGAPGAVVTAPMLATVTRPLVICDLALPRDVEPAVRGLPGVTLVDLEGLADRMRAAASGAGVEAAHTLVAEEVGRTTLRRGHADGDRVAPARDGGRRRRAAPARRAAAGSGRGDPCGAFAHRSPGRGQVAARPDRADQAFRGRADRRRLRRGAPRAVRARSRWSAFGLEPAISDGARTVRRRPPPAGVRDDPAQRDTARRNSREE